MFDVLTYMENLRSTLKITKDDYAFARVSGVDNLEEVISKDRRHSKFFAVDDSQQFQTIGINARYIERRHYTIFILNKCEYGNMDKRTEIINESRTIYRAILTKLIKDRSTGVDGLTSLNTDRISANEIPSYFATGMAGIYFSFYIDNPVSLVYNEDDWI